MNRRTFLSTAAAAATAPFVTQPLFAASKADHTLTIEPCKLEISPGVIVETTAYNGQVPGPMLRLKQGVPITIDVVNKTKDADLVHWHGLHTDPINDGAMEEGSKMIAPASTLRYNLTPEPAGTRWYHTHNTAGANLSLGGYTGQFGFLIVDPKQDAARYDQEIFLAIHHWEPSFVPMVGMLQAESANHPKNPGSDVGYKYATINGHRLGAGEPIKVKQGQKVLMHLLNASGTDNAVLALPGHTFTVIAMDGNPVPTPKPVEVLSLAVAERVDAIVEMTNPGVWILGSTLAPVREKGLGIVVEYAGKSGPPVWKDPAPAIWDYTQFGAVTAAPEPDQTIRLIFTDIGPTKDPKFDTWTINRKSWPDTDPIMVEKGKRYRLVFVNGSGDQHPMHLHRHTFEVTKVGQKPCSGLLKDSVNVMPLSTLAVDFTANNPGDSLLHCHMQLHMDFGFMQLIKYAT